VFGPRTAVEAVFLVAVPVVVLVAGKGPAVIIASAAVAYLLVLVFEAVVWHQRPQDARPAEATAVEPPAPGPEPRPHPEPQSHPEPRPDPEPEPPAAPPQAVVAPEPEPNRAPESAPAPAPPVLQSVPDPEPDPEPELEPPPPAPEPRTVVPLVPSAPRQWNLWELERLTREHVGQDEVRDEERSFLLMYLRDFAGPDGLLPVDFDGLVRDSFGDLVGAR
jgi:hypothetical protein